MRTGTSQYHYKITLTNKVFLVQTDTTVGFVSTQADRLSTIKGRPSDKAFVRVTSSFKKLKSLVRVPKYHANRIRRSTKASFVYANNSAIRVVKEGEHAAFLKGFNWVYSSSANASGNSFDKAFACANSDIIVETKSGLFEGESSSLYRLRRNRLQRLR